MQEFQSPTKIDIFNFKTYKRRFFLMKLLNTLSIFTKSSIADVEWVLHSSLIDKVSEKE